MNSNSKPLAPPLPPLNVQVRINGILYRASIENNFQRVPKIDQALAGVKVYSFEGWFEGVAPLPLESHRCVFEEVGGLNDLVSRTFALCTVSSTGATEIIPSGRFALEFPTGEIWTGGLSLWNNVSRNDTLTPCWNCRCRRTQCNK